MSVEMIGRLLSRAKERNLSPRALSLKAGLGPTTVRDIVSRPGASPRGETIRKLAEALETTPEWLSYGIGEGVEVLSDGETSAVAPAEPDLRKAPESDFARATYGGTVEAGTFREVGEFEDPDRPPDYVPRDDRFPNAAYFIFDVAGDSMNAADPPMKAGARVVAVALEHFRGRLLLQTGHIVVVERSKDDGAYRERSVKQLELDENETRFCPRSTNPRHKPIVVPKDYEPDETTKVEVLGVVIDVISKVRMP